jgi:hypothetical protein
MTEEIVEGVVSAEVDTVSRRIVPKGTLGAETSAVPPEPVNLAWKKRGQGYLIGKQPSWAAPTDGFISELNTLYEFKDGPVVESFLEENPSLGDLLFDAHEIIREHFGPETRMVLEVVADPEALGDKQLFVLIRTDLPRKDARARLAELDQAWWLYALPAAEGKMEIALE